MRTKDILVFLFAGAALGACFTLWGMSYVEAVEKSEKEEATITWKANHFKLNESNLMDELIAQDVKFPYIVLAQAILETGHFKSHACLQLNNLFGLKQSNGVYMSFGHWTESVAAYKKYIQKWEEDAPDDYYQYLSDMGYATDKDYISKVKQLVIK